MSKTYTVPPPPPHNEGNTVAAWTMTVGVILGAIVLAFGLVLGNSVLVIAGAAVIGLTLVASFALRAAGYGQKRKNSAVIAQ